MIAIETTGLTKILNGRVIFEDLRLLVSAGECIAITGDNGVGKTTLLRCLCGAIRPTSGSISWFDQTSRGDPQLRSMIGHVAHEQQIYSHLTVRENLIFAARMHGLPQPLHAADLMLQTIDLSHVANHFVSRISRGMRQRLSIARATVHEPRIAFLDEPFTGLDAQGSEWLIDLIDQLRHRGSAACVVTHQPHLIDQIADRVWHMQDCMIEEGALQHLPRTRQVA